MHRMFFLAKSQENKECLIIIIILIIYTNLDSFTHSQFHSPQTQLLHFAFDNVTFDKRLQDYVVTNGIQLFTL